MYSVTQLHVSTLEGLQLEYFKENIEILDAGREISFFTSFVLYFPCGLASTLNRIKADKTKAYKKIKMEKSVCQRGPKKQYIFVDINCTEFSKGRGALIFVHAVQVCRGFRGVDPAILNLGAGWNGEVNATSRPLYHPKRIPVLMELETWWAPS